MAVPFFFVGGHMRALLVKLQRGGFRTVNKNRSLLEAAL